MKRMVDTLTFWHFCDIMMAGKAKKSLLPAYIF